MSHLIAISIGPVQEFIAAARRTRDLYLGSRLLSDISRAVARQVESEGAQLIFPADPDADSVANVILAEVPGGKPKQLAEHCKQAAKDHWQTFARESYRQAQSIIHNDIWQEQVDDVIEFYAAWVPRTRNYRDDRANVMRLLAGRKNCRDFLPARGRSGVPKSSLDGRRESVLRKPKDWPDRARAGLRIREGEQLDVVGIVKRLALGHLPYPSITRIAADPWIREHRKQLKPIIAECKQLGNAVIRGLNLERFPQFSDFPFEGSALYVNRHRELLEELELDPQADPLGTLRRALKELPEPGPYLAVLVADGDNMGSTIAELDSIKRNQEFSTQLAQFSGQAGSIVEQHSGVMVYAGGDDVLALLPVDRCLPCARALYEGFGNLMSDFGSLTLSVGLAIGHFLENLEDLLAWGRIAERDAKQPDRNGLAIHLLKRSGAPVRMRTSWRQRPDQRLEQLARLTAIGAIPGGLAYDLRTLARIHEGWPAATAALAIRQDTLRVIRDKQPPAGRAHLKTIEEILAPLADADALKRFTEELLIARQLATAIKQDGLPVGVAP